LAAAWTGRHHELSWRWKPDAESRELDSLDAICFGAAQLAKVHAHKSPAAIVIPNDFRQREQQKLLDACSSAGVSASLIWLPVAATLAWLEKHHATLPTASPESDARLNVHVVHADWGRIRCSTLNLVRTDEDKIGCRWIPARRRPSVSDWECPGFGWKSLGSCNTKNVSEVWRSLFGNRDQGGALKGASDSNVLRQIVNWPIDRTTPGEVDSKLATHLATYSSTTAIIFVGDFARQVASGHHVSRAVGVDITYVADGLEGDDLLALGASIFAKDRLKDRISYLDTLPNLELFVDRIDRFDWLQLLGKSDQFVEGGKEWKTKEPITGFAIKQGATSVKLVVASDEEPGVRELLVPLDRPADRNWSAKLNVSAVPAQGNAKLTLSVDSVPDTAVHEIVADWKRMERLHSRIDGKTPLDKAGFEAERTWAFPNLRPRLADLQRWSGFSEAANRLMVAFSRSNNGMDSALSFQELFHATKIVQGRSPVSSEGRAPSETDQSFVDGLAEFLFDCLTLPAYATYSADQNLIKSLAYLSPKIEGLDKWIEQKIGISGAVSETTCILAGNCIRSPKVAGRFVRRLLSQVNQNPEQRLLNYQMKELGRLFSQRNNILSEITEKVLDKLVSECMKVFESELNSNHLWWLFEHSGLVIVYALRYRANNPSFLDPNSQQALKAKQLFGRAVTLIDRYIKLGNSEFGYRRLRRLRDGLQQLIKYIDEKGDGSPPAFGLDD
jgi:hypothetical protein